MAPTEPVVHSIANCPVKCSGICKRLSNFSWWMRLLCQRVAQRANHEEGETGRFFQDRYRATRLVDEASSLACAAYVDTPANVLPVLKRLGLDGASWCELVSDFGKLFCTVAGRPEQVDTLRSHRTYRRYHLRRRWATCCANHALTTVNICPSCHPPSTDIGSTVEVKRY